MKKEALRIDEVSNISNRHTDLLHMSKLISKYADSSITGDFGEIIYFSDNQCQHGPRVKFYGGTKETMYTDKSPSLMFNDKEVCEVVLENWHNKQNCPNGYDSQYIQKVKNFVNNQLPLLLLVWYRKLDEADLLQYFQGRTNYSSIISLIEVTNKQSEELTLCKNNNELHQFCLKYNLYKL